MIRQCCQCKKIEVGGHWVYPRFNQLEGQDISHGYCEECFAICKKQYHAQLYAAPVWKRWVTRLF
jgi:hypothetical protein